MFTLTKYKEYIYIYIYVIYIFIEFSSKLSDLTLDLNF